MNLLEEMKRLVATHAQLQWVESFLTEQPTAHLFLVGGAVRDLIMRRAMHDVDFDFVVRGMDAQAIENWFSPRGKIDFVGRTFGVYRFVPEGMDPSRTPFMDIALPRTEKPDPQSKGGYRDFHIASDPHLPIEDDLSRRDFTMNAMAIDLRTGTLIDPFGGTHDLQQRLIRAVGDPRDRFNEDLSRMLRAIRFASELHFEMEEQTLSAIKAHIGRINDQYGEPPQYIVPRETVGSELAKALARNPSGAARWLVETGAMAVLFKDGSDISHLQEGNPTLAVALLLRAQNRQNLPWLLAATGLDSLPRGTPLRIEPSDVCWLHDRLNENWSAQSVMSLRASLFEKYFMHGRAQLLLEALAATGCGAALDAARDRARDIRERWSADESEPIPPLVSGNEIVNAGIPAGPRVREMLDRIRDEQLEGSLLTREQAKRFLTSVAKEEGSQGDVS